ncbi:MAG: glycosyltransferase family 2 protein [Aquabacterium sp.]|nr:glycosyltransferase family 2 protein [Aquabacterium sp.]
MNTHKQKISVIIPILNEQDSISETIRRLVLVNDKHSREIEFEFIVVDDGSTDDSLTQLRIAAQQQSSIKVISLSRNFGHQIAITAGMDHASGDYVAIIDGDLQDPPELIYNMYQIALRQGVDIVYGKRVSRAGETLFKKGTAALFYRLMRYMCEIDIPSDTGDFRLMSRRATDSLKQMREKHRFVRGMVPWMGFKSMPFEYARAERFAGETKFPLRKMVAFASNAILSFSSKPLTLAIRIGIMLLAAGLMGGLYILYLKLFTNTTVPGLTAILLSIVIFSGIQILLIGVVGEYIARIFDEIKQRPLYFIGEKINM